jgi:hypothetical protein
VTGGHTQLSSAYCRSQSHHHTSILVAVIYYITGQAINVQVTSMITLASKDGYSWSTTFVIQQVRRLGHHPFDRGETPRPTNYGNTSCFVQQGDGKSTRARRGEPSTVHTGPQIERPTEEEETPALSRKERREMNPVRKRVNDPRSVASLPCPCNGCYYCLRGRRGPKEILPPPNP